MKMKNASWKRGTFVKRSELARTFVPPCFELAILKVLARAACMAELPPGPKKRSRAPTYAAISEDLLQSPGSEGSIADELSDDSPRSAPLASPARTNDPEGGPLDEIDAISSAMHRCTLQYWDTLDSAVDDDEPDDGKLLVLRCLL
jgi:hypothetical protein